MNTADTLNDAGHVEDPLIPTSIPALVVILLNREETKGSPLTREEVEEIRDKAVCVMLPSSKEKSDG